MASRPDIGPKGIPSLEWYLAWRVYPIIVAEANAGFTNCHLKRSTLPNERSAIVAHLLAQGYHVDDGDYLRDMSVSWGARTIYRSDGSSERFRA